MPRPFRIRPIFFRFGICTIIILSISWAISAFYQLMIWHSSPDGDRGLSLSGGRVVCIRTWPPTRLGFVGQARAGTLGLSIDVDQPGTFEWEQYGFRIQREWGSTGINLPIWFLMLATAIPTAWLWHRDRRRIPPGHCPRCGYDLTGNTSGVCSECGERVSAMRIDAQIAAGGAADQQQI